jgi:predicted ATPase/class 3 adenylate cyclase
VSAIPDPVPESQSTLPAGTVTFVFTDIEGSTQRWDRDPDAMQAALRRHDAILREAIANAGGYVFKTIGDAFCAAFSRPSDALTAALAIQRTLAAEDFSAVDGLRVRIAIHAGQTDERESDYFGPVVNRVARLLATAHGGQVIVSGTVRELAGGALPPDVELRDLGEHRLKDLERAERVFQLAVPDLVSDFPPLRSLSALSNNLPSATTSFVGRETEIAAITALLEKNRLVTLTGSGGLGKTRTSLQVAANLIDRFRDGVWFIELAPLAQGDLIPSTIAQVLEFTLPPESDPLESLARNLAGKTMLLVLDNCEHLIEAASKVAATLLRRAPNVKVLASSRQTLGVGGEAAYRMPSLDEPTAIELFASRAQSVDQRFVLSGENRPAIAEICTRLDGIPLAIELAAARITIFTPKQLSGRLNERFRVLTGGRRDALPRQQTLRALIDWSYDLLDAREQQLFRRLGVFVNGFLAEGAVAVGSSEDVDEFGVLDTLGSLVDKSLVLAETQGEQTRYRLLESTRAYALEKLDASGERGELQRRHLAYLREHMRRAHERFSETIRNAELDEAVGSELEDIRAALGWSLTGDPVGGADLLSRVGTVWISLGPIYEGLEYLEKFVQALPEEEDDLLSGLWLAISRLREEIWDDGQLEAAAKTVAYARRHGGKALANALGRFSWAAVRMKNIDEAEAALKEAMAIPGLPASSQLSLEVDWANVVFARDPEEGSRLYEKLWRDHQTLGDAWNWGMAYNVAESEVAVGRFARSISIMNEVLPGMRERADRAYLGRTLLFFAGYHVELGAMDEARRHAREALELLAPREPNSGRTTAAIQLVALLFAERGKMTDAAMLDGYTGAFFSNSRRERNLSQEQTEKRLEQRLTAALPEAELERLRAAGANLSAAEAIAIASRED